MKRTSNKSLFINFDSNYKPISDNILPTDPKKISTLNDIPIKILQIQGIPYGQDRMRILIEYEVIDKSI